MSEWRVKYDGTCARCGVGLVTGTVAVWHRTSRTMHCAECVANPLAPPAALAIDTGVAGASARRVHERRTAARETRVKRSFGNRLGRVVLAVTSEAQSTRAWDIGARGEEKLAKSLEAIDGVRILHDRRVPGSRGNIDHIVIGPAGIFVVDAKKYVGLIRIRNRGWFLRPQYRLYVGHRDCSHLAEGLEWQVEAVRSALRSAAIEPLPTITPVLCFVDGEWPLLSPPDSYAGVRLESARSIRRLLTAPGEQDIGTIERLAQILAASLPSR